MVGTLRFGAGITLGTRRNSPKSPAEVSSNQVSPPPYLSALNPNWDPAKNAYRIEETGREKRSRATTGMGWECQLLLDHGAR